MAHSTPSQRPGRPAPAVLSVPRTPPTHPAPSWSWLLGWPSHPRRPPGVHHTGSPSLAAWAWPIVSTCLLPPHFTVSIWDRVCGPGPGSYVPEWGHRLPVGMSAALVRGSLPPEGPACCSAHAHCPGCRVQPAQHVQAGPLEPGHLPVAEPCVASRWRPSPPCGTALPSRQLLVFQWWSPCPETEPLATTPKLSGGQRLSPQSPSLLLSWPGGLCLEGPFPIARQHLPACPHPLLLPVLPVPPPIAVPVPGPPAGHPGPGLLPAPPATLGPCHSAQGSLSWALAGSPLTSALGSPAWASSGGGHY